MRDFLDAKAMARTLRAELAAKSVAITNSESLELIAKSFGLADWNTLSALIGDGRAAPPPPEQPGPSYEPTDVGGVGFSATLEATLLRAKDRAQQRKHQDITLEHLLFALMDDVEAADVLKACGANSAEMRARLAASLNNKRAAIAGDDNDAAPTPAFQRVLQRALLLATDAGGRRATGAAVLVALLSEHESYAAQILREQNVTRDGVLHYLAGKARK